MRVGIVIICLALVFAEAFAQTTIRGTIRDDGGKPVPYANVFLAGTTEGAMADRHGTFSFATKRTGEVELIASSVGYERFKKKITLQDGKSVVLSITMYPMIITTGEVVITASSYASEKGKGVVMSSMDVLTTPGGAADIYQSLKTLPGLTQVSESAQLYVRGGDPTETITLIDQASMYNPYTLESAYGGLFSNLNTNAVKTMYFSSGGFSSKYGNVLSGVLDIETKDQPDLLRISLLAGLHGAALSTELPLSGQSVGMRLDARQSYTKPIFVINGGLDRFTATPESRDVSGSVIFRYSQTGQLKLSTLLAEDAQSVKVERAEYYGVFNGRSTNGFVNLQHKDLLGDNLILKTSASYNRYRNSWEFGILDLTRTDDVLKLRTDIEELLSSRIKLGFGAEAERRRSALAGVVPDRFYNIRPDGSGFVLDNKLEGVRYGGYVELEVQKLPGVENLFAVAGVRGDHIRPLDLSWVDPRAGIGYRISGSSTLKLGWGIFHQLPDVRLFSSSSGNPNLKPMKATHYIAGYDWKMDELNDLRIELYHKKYKGLPLKHAVLRYDNGGHGYSWGIDIMAKGVLGPISGWVSYGYLDTRRLWMDYKESAPSSYDITHNVALVAKYNITAALQIGFNFKHATGRPYTPFVGARYDSSFQVYEPLEGATNSARYPNYRRLDIRLTYLTKIFDRYFTVAFVEILNTLNTNNIFGYTYSMDYSEKREIKSYFGRRTVVFGVQVTI